MGQQRCKTVLVLSTILSWPLLLVLIAPPVLGAAASNKIPISMDPAKWHSQAQRNREQDEYWTVDQTRIDSRKTVAQAVMPASPPSYPAPSTRVQPSQRHVVRGAGRGAALGAVGGAIAGDAGKGAAAGAAMGGLAGGFRRRDARRQQGLSPR
jgi:Glycine-zipper domain